MNVTYSVIEHKSVQVLSINSLRDEWQNRQILKALQHKIDTGANRFVVDLAQLNLVNSVGLNFLLSLFSRTKKKGGALILANPSKRILHILETTKLSTIFPVKKTVETAVDSIAIKIAA